MSSIAQKLCDEIVEPALKPSSDGTSKRSSSKFLTPSKQDSKTTRSIVIERKKVINKLVPNDSNASKTKFKSRETLFSKKFIDSGVNTVVTGPLRCDTDCVTLVRKRDNKCSCKCSLKPMNGKGKVKQIQTFDSRVFNLLDKACCAHCIETSTCGTQFLERISDAIKPHSSPGPKKSNKDIMKCNACLKDPFRSRKENITIRPTISKPTFHNYMGARRWALSQYPTRGPDF